MENFIIIEKKSSAPAVPELSGIDRVCISRLVGHTIAQLERELILHTLRHNRGNRIVRRSC